MRESRSDIKRKRRSKTLNLIRKRRKCSRSEITATLDIDKKTVSLVVDDLLATGVTALAAAKLIEKLGGEIVEASFIVNLPDVGGEAKLRKKNYEVFSLTEFEGE